MKQLRLNLNLFTMVDDEDYEELSKFKWSQFNGYAGRRITPTLVLYLHRELLKVYDPNIQVDHIDGCKVNNRKSNLRIATKGQNLQNSFRKDNTSGYKGVSLGARGTKWRARVGKELIGSFETKEEAARAYDKRALEIYGPDARVNFPFANDKPRSEICLLGVLP